MNLAQIVFICSLGFVAICFVVLVGLALALIVNGPEDFKKDWDEFLAEAEKWLKRGS